MTSTPPPPKTEPWFSASNALPRWSPKFKGPNPVEVFGKERHPDFICIGTEKAGTTWLWNCLMAHPEVGVAATKELRFFDDNTQVDYLHFRALKELLENPRGAPRTERFMERLAIEVRLLYGGLPAYYRVFGQLDQPVVGELSPQYCLLPPPRLRQIHNIAPDARIIYMLRDPVSRLLSGCRMALRARGEALNDDVMQQETLAPVQRFLSNSMVHIEKYERVFGTEKVGVFFFDDIQSDPAGLLTDVCKFIGATSVTLEDALLQKEVNKGTVFEAAPDLQRTLYLELKHVYDRLEERYPDRIAAWRAKYEMA